MKAVWSFWSKPFAAHRHAMWPSEKHHLCSWVLSVETARQHYPDTWLVTDDAGARLLVDDLGLQFKRVTTDLNALAQHDPDWWCLGKLSSYRLQTEPFVHIDNDVFLWKRLPARLERAPVFAQCPEPFEVHRHYRPEQLTLALLGTQNGWLPDEWHWHRRARRPYGVCCGILGGTGIELIRRFAEASYRIIDDPSNRRWLQGLSDKPMQMVAIEQYLLVAFVECQNASAAARAGRISLEWLFGSMGDAWNPACAAQAGFTHLLGSAKSNPLLMDRLVRTVRRDYPELYTRCVRLANTL